MYSRKRSSRLNLWRRNLRDRVHCEVDQRRQRKNLLSAFAKWCENVLNYVRMVCPLVNCFYHMFKSCLSELRGVADVYVEVLEHFSCHVCRVLKHLRSFYPSVYVRMSCTPGRKLSGMKSCFTACHADTSDDGGFPFITTYTWVRLLTINTTISKELNGPFFQKPFLIWHERLIFAVKWHQ